MVIGGASSRERFVPDHDTAGASAGEHNGRKAGSAGRASLPDHAERGSRGSDLEVELMFGILP
jgi:hypothetical protein